VVDKVSPNFRERVESLVAQIPTGRVMTYGQIAALCGQAGAARVVGGIAHFGNPKLPWQRVVKKHGGLADGYPGGKLGHKQAIEAEGVKVSENYFVAVSELIWWPKDSLSHASNKSEPITVTNKPYTELPLIVIVGETASGKSALAMQIAKRFNGEIIAADSRTVYKGMDVGTAKPSATDQAMVPHHLLDITTPDKPINAASFKQLAVDAIEDISARGKLPILVGGTGLYIDAVIFDFQFRPVSDQNIRKELSLMSVQELQTCLIKKEIPLPENSLNPRHLTRALESAGKVALQRPLSVNTLVLGLSIERAELTEKVIARTEVMFSNGLEAETRRLVETYGWITSLQTIGYQEFKPYFAGSQSLNDTKTEIVRNTLAYARRQRTWFKRNNSIRWIAQQREAVELITTYLNKQR
jgi:tRNA dimethylallyltransferase